MCQTSINCHANTITKNTMQNVIQSCSLNTRFLDSNTIPRYIPIPGTSSAPVAASTPPSTEMVNVTWEKLTCNKVKSRQ